MSNGNRKKTKKTKASKPEALRTPAVTEDTTFIVMVLRPADTSENGDKVMDSAGGQAILTGWCVIAAHGIAAAMRHVGKIDLAVDLRGAEWKDVSGGKAADLSNGFMIQVLPAPLYVVEDISKMPKIVPAPYVM